MKEDILADSHPDHPANAKPGNFDHFLARAEAAQADRAQKVKALVTLAIAGMQVIEPEQKVDDKSRNRIALIASYVVDAVGILLRPGHDKLYALEASAGQFRHYERLHAAKGTPDGDAKAAINANFATLCEQAIIE